MTASALCAERRAAGESFSQGPIEEGGEVLGLGLLFELICGILFVAW